MRYLLETLMVMAIAFGSLAFVLLLTVIPWALGIAQMWRAVFGV